MTHPLDDPVLAALTGPHAHLAERAGRLLRYPVDAAPWLAFTDGPTDADWAALAALAGPGAEVSMPLTTAVPPADWEYTLSLPGVQLVDTDVAADAAVDPEAVRLTPADVPDMLDLVARTKPGPFLPRTIELGTYLAIRRGGRLVAMAGERMHPPGWVEISAVCTAPEARGQGLAGRLITTLTALARARDERAFLHAAAENTGAIRLYENLGFRHRADVRFRVARVPKRSAEVPVAT
ncbi:GNAT family N-acetyltransferase [Streptomyces sp. NPDC050560]|uniref:GNAT family N-acetyltransferase n=1 Tax=Streptomyces sp. NPDC050560 TaxID=3365630 RepID=UPI0037979899